MKNNKTAAKKQGNKQHKAALQEFAEIQNLMAKVADVAPVAFFKFRLDDNGVMSAPYTSASIKDIYGLTPEEIAEDFYNAWDQIHPDDNAGIAASIQKSASTLEPLFVEFRVMHPVKGEIWMKSLSKPEPAPDGSVVWYGYIHDVTDVKHAQQEHNANLHFFECMDQVNRAIQGAKDLEQMMGDVLDVLLNVFECDRAWFLYPCDPEAASWRIPMERTRPEYPGGYAAGIDFEMDMPVSAMMRILLDSNEPVTFGPGSVYPLPGDIAEEYSMKSIISLVLYPKISKPWMFGLHQCSYSRIWTPDEKKLLEEIGRRISDALTSLLVYRDLGESEERFRQAFEFAGIGMGILSIDGHWLRANYNVCEMLGYTQDELCQTSYQALTHPDDLIHGQAYVQRLIAGEIPFMQIEKRYRHRDGHFIWARLTTSIVRNSRNEPMYFVSHIEDINQRKQAEGHLILLSFALNRVNEGVYLIDEDSHFHYVNDEACRALGYTREELLGMGVPDIDPDYQMSRWREHWEEIKTKGSVILETIHKTKDGSVYPVEINANYFEYDGRSYNLALERNITERKVQEERIQYLAYHDALTGLPNRVLVMNRLEQALAQAQRHGQILAVLFVDLDRFKTINDTLGHPAGDKLLQLTGNCLVDTLRDEDTVGRVGGDEYLILLPGLDTVQDAAHVTGKIHKSLSSPFNVAGHHLHITTSIGISLYPRDADNPETLVKYADTALYLAKEQGRNTFRFFSPELDAKVHARLLMENDLRLAIDRNELVLHYQPQMSLLTGKMSGAEILLRWNHPKYGLVPPAEFITIAEDTGLIIPIGEWVLRNACMQARAWQDAGISDFRISINLSGRQLEQSDFAETLSRILKETGCDPGLLELEITESTVMNHPEDAQVKLKVLHDMGIQLAMDDFGTGYSSLAYLKRFPLDRLKIDKSFVDGIPDDNDDIAIVQTTIVLAQLLRLKVTAEGVETDAQQQFLKANGCDEIQGFLLSKPLFPQELERLSGFPVSA